MQCQCSTSLSIATAIALVLLNMFNDDKQECNTQIIAYEIGSLVYSP